LYLALSYLLAAAAGFILAVAATRALHRRSAARRAITQQDQSVAADRDEREDSASARIRRYGHELNNVLTGLGGFAELARTRPNDDPDLAAYLDQIVLNARRAVLLTRRMLGSGVPDAQTIAPEDGRPAGTVLVVDDEETVRDYAALALVELGYAVHRAASGPEALMLADAHAGTIDLVLTDVMMPDMTGPELVRRLAERHPSIAVAFMSGYEHRRLAKERMIDRDDVYLAKPFTPEALAATVAAALARRLDGKSARVA